MASLTSYVSLQASIFVSMSLIPQLEAWVCELFALTSVASLHRKFPLAFDTHSRCLCAARGLCPCYILGSSADLTRLRPWS